MPVLGHRQHWVPPAALQQMSPHWISWTGSHPDGPSLPGAFPPAYLPGSPHCQGPVGDQIAVETLSPSTLARTKSHRRAAWRTWRRRASSRALHASPIRCGRR
jgi:hypothetical protein